MSKEQGMFPDRFEFYGLGFVKRQPRTMAAGYKPSFIVLFEVLGDTKGHCVVEFEDTKKPVDTSILLECANIVVAKLCDQMTESTGVPTSLSPPFTILPSDSKYNLWLKLLDSAVHYELKLAKLPVRFRSIYIPGTVANA
jgi:hypothetical protein